MLENMGFWNVFDGGVLALELTLLFIAMDELSNRKKGDKVVFISFIINLIIIEIIQSMVIFTNGKSIIVLISCIIVYKYNYDVHWAKAFIIPAAFTMLGTVFDLLSISIVKAFNSVDNIQLILDYNLYRLQGIMISKLLLLITVSFLKYKKIPNIIEKKDFSYIGIPLLTNIISILLIFRYEVACNNMYGLNNNLSIWASLLLCLSSISLVSLVFKIAKNNKLKLENTLMKEKIELEYNYYMKLEENQKKVSRIYHDMKNHMLCISSLSDNNDVNEYIQNINLQLNKVEYTYKTGNKILDIIMNEKKSICDEENINLEVVANVSKVEFINMTDICVLFSNALDNAIQACGKIKDSKIEKYIKLNVTYVNEFCIIKLENSKVNKIVEVNKIIITDKGDKFYHGIGIKNIKNILEKYDGEININYDDDKFILTMMIPLKMSKFA